MHVSAQEKLIKHEIIAKNLYKNGLNKGIFNVQKKLVSKLHKKMEENVANIYVIDALPGTGKTSAMINFINSTAAKEKFIYISPFLDEVERIIKSCPKKKFVQPKDGVANVSKLSDLKSLVVKGKNISSTHALFGRFDEETAALIEKKGYTLIMDEAMNVIQEIKISARDTDILLKYFVEKTQDGRYVWVDKEYDGIFRAYRKLFEKREVYRRGNGLFMGMFPHEIFNAFKSTYIMTYMFDAQIQRYYFDYYDLQYEKLYVKGDSIKTYEITDDPIKYKNPNLGKLIHVFEEKQLNDIGRDKYALSKAWYEKNDTKKLMNNTLNFFRRKTGLPSKMNMWTTFKDYRKDVAGASYAKGFLPLNTRATNQYSHKKVLAYLANRFMHPTCIHIFSDKGVHVDQDAYALSELVQWIFRSAVRNNEEVTIYIPSKRMRDLLKEWIKEVSE